MERILMPEDMAATDKAMTWMLGIESRVLIERAALSMLEVIEDKDSKIDCFKPLILCGIGNNGADGLCLARLLLERGIRAELYICAGLEKASEGFKLQYGILEKLGFEFLSKLPEENEYYSLIVDAIFGISLNRLVEGEYRRAVEFINGCRDRYNGKCRVLSVDMPSGISSSTGAVLGCGVQADMTVTFGYKKTGALLYPGTLYCGRLIYKKSGFFDEALKYKTNIKIYEEEEIRLPKRPEYSNKGTFGKLLFIAGSPQMCGAALLGSLSAMRLGLGMLKVVTAIENREAFLKVLPEAMLECYAGDLIPEEGLKQALSWCDCVAVGPGISQSETARRLTEFAIRQNYVPVILDADALNIISENPEILLECSQGVVITPHVGEMSRLTGIGVAKIQEHLIETAADFAKAYEAVVVLKDARSIIASPYGEIIINTNGNSGMATAGTGDVLTGMIGALVAGGMEPVKAASLACALHGRAGDEAALALSEPELLARDIVKYMGE